MSIISTVCQEEAGVLTPTPSATPTKPLFTDNNKLLPFIEEESESGKREGESDMEQFAKQEADDRLDQLLMEDEMTHITELSLTTTDPIIINELPITTTGATGDTSTNNTDQVSFDRERLKR